MTTIGEQVRAVTGKADLICGGDALDSRVSHVAAPLVVLVELAPDKRQRAGLAVEGVARLQFGRYEDVLEGHLEGVALDGGAIHAIDNVVLWHLAVVGEGDGGSCRVEAHVAVGEGGSRGGGHALAQGKGKHAREVTRLVLALVDAGIISIHVALVIGRAHAAL